MVQLGSKLLVLCLLLIGCSRAPSQEEIDEAANIQLSERLSCALIAVKLNASGEVAENEEGRFCKIVIGSKNTIPYGFSFDEVKAIKRFLLIQQEQELNEQNTKKKQKRN